MLVRGAFNHLLRPGLRKDFRDTYQDHPEEYPIFLKVGTQDRAEIEAVTYSGLPRQVILTENEGIPYFDPKMSDKFIFVDDEFGLGFMISRRLIEDDLYGKANQSSKWLGRSSRLTQEHRAAQLLDDAFTGATFTGIFDEPLISTTHALLGSSSTVSNRVSGDPQLSVTGLEAAMDVFENMKDQQNEPIVAQPKLLLVSPGDRWMAKQLFESELEPFTSDNQINVLRNIIPSFAISHYKTDTNSWFLIDPMLNDAHFDFRRQPSFQDTTDFDTGAAKFKSDQRFNIWFFDWRGWVGSNPS